MTHEIDNSKRLQLWKGSQYTGLPINNKLYLSTFLDDPNRGICVADRTTALNTFFSKPLKRTDVPGTDPTARVAIPLQRKNQTYVESRSTLQNDWLG